MSLRKKLLFKFLSCSLYLILGTAVFLAMIILALTINRQDLTITYKNDVIAAIRFTDRSTDCGEQPEQPEQSTTPNEPFTTPIPSSSIRTYK
jgi:hypothetical protein